VFANFRKTFHPTKEEIQEQIKWLKEHPLPNKTDIKLIKTHDGLWVSQPLRNFNGQCTDCNYYIEDKYNHYTEDGQCNLYKCTCGWGFTCDDFIKKEMMINE